MTAPTVTIACAAALLALAACASGDNDAPLYQTGYGDGCNTANAESNPGAEPQRNAVLYAMDPDYRAGWNAGHSDCHANSAARQ